MGGQIVVDVTDGPAAGAARYRDEFDRYLAAGGRDDVRVVGRGRYLTDTVAIVLDQYEREGRPEIPAEYLIPDTSRRVVNFIRSTVHNRRFRGTSPEGPCPSL